MKPQKTIILTLAIAFFGFMGLLFFTLRTKSKDVSHLPPYVTFIGKDLQLTSDILLLKNEPQFVFEKPLLMVEKNTSTSSEIVDKQLVPSGTKIQLTSAKLFTNGTSGSTSSVLFGYIVNSKIEFEVIWGEEHFVVGVDEPNYFTFTAPLWETELDFTGQRFVFD